MKVKKIVIILLFISLLFAGYLLNYSKQKKIEKENNFENTVINSNLDSTDNIIGTSLVVSIYSDDAETNWATASQDDINNTLNNLKIATDWLTLQVKKYNKEAKFIYDWQEFDDIKYTSKFENYNFKENRDGYYFYQRKWIEDNIDVDKLKKKYQYDNIIFIFLFNMQSASSFVRSNASNGDVGVFDIINLFVQDEIYTPAASYAHEILHTYGAPDLYRINEYINQDYIDYVDEFRNNDIMYSVNSTKEITNIFSDIDAYYVGLIDECDDVTKWNLRKKYTSLE